MTFRVLFARRLMSVRPFFAARASMDSSGFLDYLFVTVAALDDDGSLFDAVDSHALQNEPLVPVSASAQSAQARRVKNRQMRGKSWDH